MQLNLPGDRAKNQARCWKEKKLLSLTHLFVSPSTSQLLSPEWQNVTLMPSTMPSTIRLKTRYVVSSGVYLLIVGMKCIIVHLGLQRQQSRLHTVNQPCGQTLPTILVFVIYSSLLLFPSSPLEPHCLE